MTVICVQFDIAWENKTANFAKVRHLVSESKPEKNSLVLLPEMFATGFSMNIDAMAEPYGGQIEQFLSGLAKEFGIYVVAGAAMRGRDGRARNKALVFSPAGELAGFYAKMRPFTPGGEAAHYTAGEHPVAVQLQGIHVAPFVCGD